jgi:NAD-dependent DNA ligase
MAQKQNKLCIAITGNLKALNRDEAIKSIHMAGFTHAINMDISTTHIVIGSDPNGHQILKANRNGLKFWREGEFLRVIADHISGREKE